MNLLRDRLGSALAVLLLAGAGATFGAAPATAATAAQGPGPVAGPTEPAVPADLLFRAAGTDQLVAVNPTTAPLVVLDPDGAPFLRLSAAGVETDAANPFTYRSRFGADTATVLPVGVAPGAAARWTRVSDDVSWGWHDPRLRPAAGAAPVGGRDDVRQVLARWDVPMTYAGTPTTLTGTLEREPPAAGTRLVADPPPAGLTAVYPGATRVVLAATGSASVTVLGVDGEEFLRRTPDGAWEVAATSRTHRLDLIAAGRPVPAATGWLPHSGPGPVSWSDPRLGGGVERWSVPVLVDGRAVELAGVRTPVAGPVAAPAGPNGVVVAALAVLGLGALLAALSARHRRRAPSAGPSPAGAAPAGAPLERTPTP